MWEIYFHINYGVTRGFLTLRKAVTTHVKKYNIFSRVSNIANQLVTRHSPFAPLGQVDDWTAKPSPLSIQGRLSEFFRIMAAKTLKNPYRLQTMTFKLSEKGKKPKYRKKNRKLRIQWHLWRHLSRLRTKIDNVTVMSLKAFLMVLFLLTFRAIETHHGKISAQPHTSLCMHILLIMHSTLCLWIQ